jgi:hypothetical protein
MKRIMFGNAIAAGLAVVGIGLLPGTRTSTAPVASTSTTTVEAETIGLFRRGTPAIVHVFAQSLTLATAEDDGGSQQTGSGFLW